MFSQRPRSPLALSDEDKSPYKQMNGHRPEWDQPITKLDQMKHTSTLSGLNVPRTDFLKALNFERFSARSRLLDEPPKKVEANVQASLSSENDSEDGSEEESAEEEDDEVDEENHVDQEEQEHRMVNGFADASDQEQTDDSEDGVDNDAGLDQVELLAKFKELRDLQLQEQQRMMLEQQKQLERLRDEQLRVQDILMQQQIAAMSPKKPPSRNTSMNESGLKLKLINSPRKQQEEELDYNHNVKEPLVNGHCESSSGGSASQPGMSDEEDGEDVDEDYLQCSMVETEAEAHVNHVEHLLRNSRDLFGARSLENHGLLVNEKSPEKTPSNPQNKDLDINERPVSGARKTFEELLEDRLSQEKANETPTAPSSSGVVRKRPFLKRGQGTARFGVLSPAVSRKPTPIQNQAVRSPSPVKKSSSAAPTNEVVLKLQRTSPTKSPIRQKTLPNSNSKRDSLDSLPNSPKKTRLDDVDLDDLEEFELFEKYADDDYSFTSNCSIIKARPQKMKKYVVGFGSLSEENNAESLEDARTKTPEMLPSMNDEPPSSTPRRLKRKIASKIGPTTTVEKDVMVEDYSPSVGEMNGHAENGLDDDDDDKTLSEDDGQDFDDDETWANEIPKPNFSRPNQASKTEEAPPTSKLVARLFPSLKPQPKEVEQPKPVPASEGVMSKALKDKLAELEAEIDKFRQENAVLAKIKKERLDGLEALKNEVEQFERKKAAEMEEINEMRDSETKKIKHERKMFEKYQKEMRAIPDKNQRREIDELKAELADLKDELRQKEIRFSSSTNRLRNRIETLEKENSDLQEEIKVMEKQRLDLWQKELSANNEKKKKTQCVPPQQQRLRQTQENGPSEALRQQFDKLLRASLDDVQETKQEVQKKAKSKAKEAAVKNTESHPREAKISKSREPQKSQDGSKAKPLNHPTVNHNKPEVNIDLGDGKYREFRHPDGKMERTYANGCKEVLFANGSRKLISQDGDSVIVSFFNGDVKQILPDQRVIYYYADSKTKHTTYPDGIEILQFPNQQTEKHYPNGTREIVFPDQTIKYLYPGGAEESVFADGTVVKVDQQGGRVMTFPNGQKEIHTKEYKRREYPDGTSKTVYPDGRQETRYSSGRLRIKDADGNILVDKVC